MSIAPLEEIFRRVFKKADLVITEDLSAKKVKGWDSFTHITLLLAIEEHFDITFGTDEMVSFANVGELVKLMQAKGVDIAW